MQADHGLINAVHHLYRHFDKDDNLLYVGISLSALTRMRDHAYQSVWFAEIRRVEIESHPSRAAALEAEGVAIRVEKPKYNVSKSLSRPARKASTARRTLARTVVEQPQRDDPNSPERQAQVRRIEQYIYDLEQCGATRLKAGADALERG